MSSIIGWDVGGAHLKAALVEDGRLAKVVQLPCELWRGMDRLEIALDQATARLGHAQHHAITTTGELVDYFPNRLEGVDRIVTAMARRLGGQHLVFYAGPRGFVTAERELDIRRGHRVRQLARHRRPDRQPPSRCAVDRSRLDHDRYRADPRRQRRGARLQRP